MNRVCPKDTYPLLSIDRSEYEMLSFLDGYLGYNQIRMYPSDEDKMTFMIERSNYCYQVIPFGLKNVEATYQRLMDKIFHDLLGKTIEVYVDDMVVKSAKDE